MLVVEALLILVALAFITVVAIAVSNYLSETRCDDFFPREWMDE